MELKDLIKPNLILSDLEAKTNREALRKIVEHLMKEGYVEEGYLQKLLEREKQFPTGLCTMPFAVALPHTESDHILKPCIAIAKLKKPVGFYEMVNDKNMVQVHYIFNLVLQKTEQQLELLQILIGIFSNEKIMKILEKEDEPEKIAKILLSLQKPETINRKE